MRQMFGHSHPHAGPRRLRKAGVPAPPAVCRWYRAMHAIVGGILILAARSLARKQTFALRALASEFTRPANRLGLFARLLLRRLLVMTTKFHLAKDAFALHFLLQRLQRLVDIVVANQYLHAFFPIVCTSRRVAAKRRINTGMTSLV